MAYSTKELEKQILKAIEGNNLMFFDDIQAYVEPSNKTLYNHKLQELQTIKSLLAINRIKTKIELKKKWRESDNPTLQIALYKLLATDIEFERISMQRLDHTSKGESIQPIQINVSSKGNAKELKEFLQDASKLN